MKLYFLLFFCLLSICKSALVRVGDNPGGIYNFQYQMYSVGDKYVLAVDKEGERNFSIYVGDSNGAFAQIPMGISYFHPVLAWKNYLLYIDNFGLSKLNVDTLEKSFVFAYYYIFDSRDPPKACLLGDYYIFAQSVDGRAEVKYYDLTKQENATIIGGAQYYDRYSFDCSNIGDGVLVTLRSKWLVRLSGEVLLVSDYDNNDLKLNNLYTDGYEAFTTYLSNPYIYYMTGGGGVPIMDTRTGPQPYYAFKKSLLFSNESGYQLYNPTTKVVSLAFRIMHLNYEFNGFKIFNDNLFITIAIYNNSYSAYEKYVYRTDGTPQGTIMVGKLGLSTVRYFDYVAEGCGNMFFTIEDTNTKYKSLWVMDGFQMKQLVVDIQSAGKFAFINTSVVFTGITLPDIKTSVYTYDIGMCAPFSGATTTGNPSTTSSSPSSSSSSSSSGTTSNNDNGDSSAAISVFSSTSFVLAVLAFLVSLPLEFYNFNFS